MSNRWIVTLDGNSAEHTHAEPVEIVFYGDREPQIVKDLALAMLDYGYKVKVETETRQEVIWIEDDEPAQVEGNK